MDDRCLDRGELACFSVSRFDCEVRRHERNTPGGITEHIKVTVCMGGSEKPIMVRNFSSVDMTLREIKQVTAFHILHEIGIMQEVVHAFYKQPPFPAEK